MRFERILFASAALSSSVYAADFLTIDASLGNSPYVVATDGTYSIVYVGDTTVGEATQNAGVLTAFGVTLGNLPSASGAYSLTGGSLNLTAASVGEQGSGSFVQSAGTLTCSSMRLGNSPSGIGHFTMNGGTATANIYIGLQGRGIFDLNGGTLKGDIAFGGLPGAGNVLNLKGGILNGGSIIGLGENIVNFDGTLITGASMQIRLAQGRIQSGGARFQAPAGSNYSATGLIHDPLLGNTIDGGVVLQGPGNLLLSGNNTYTGDTVIQSGTLTVDGDHAAGSGRIVFGGGTLKYSLDQYNNVYGSDYSAQFAVADNQAIRIDTNNRTVTAAANLGGIGSSLTKLGIGTLRLTGSNSYTGTTTVSGGTLVASAPAALPGYDSGRVTVLAGATLGLGLGPWDGNSIASVVDHVTFASGATLALEAAAEGYTLTSPLSGSMPYAKTGNGTLTLSGSNSFSSGIKVLSGTLMTTRPAALPGYSTSGKVSVENGGTLGFRFGSSGEWTAGEIDNALSHTRFASGSTIAVDTTAGEAVLQYAIANAYDSPIGVTKSGPGTLTLAGASNYTGLTNVLGGTLNLTAGTVGNGFLGGIFNISGGTTLRIAGSAQVIPNYAGNFYLDNNANLEVADNGLLNNANSFIIGNTTAAAFVQNGGQFYAGSSFTLGNAAGTNGQFTLNGGYAYGGSGVKVGVSGTGNFTMNGGTFETSIVSDLIVAALSGSVGTLQLNGGTILTYGIGGGSGTSSVLLNGVTLKENGNQGKLLHDLTNARVSKNGFTVDSNGIPGSIPQKLTHDPALPGIDGGITKIGEGSLTLSGDNSYTGPTTIAAGSIVPMNANAMGIGGPILFTGGTLTYSSIGPSTDYSSRFSSVGNQQIRVNTNGLAVTYAASLSGTGTSLNKLGTGTLLLSGLNSYTGPTTVSGGQLTAVTPASLPGFGVPGGVVALAGTTVAVRPTSWSAAQITDLANNGTFASGAFLGLESTSGNYTLIGSLGGGTRYNKVGTGTLVLAGPNSFSNGITVSSGTLVAANPSALPGYDIAGSIAVQNAAVLAVRAGGDNGWQSADIVTLRANASFSSSQASLGFDTTDAPSGFVFTGSLSGGIGVQKLGNNTLSIKAPQTYSGNTSVTGGTLSVETGGTLGTGNVVVSGGTLTIKETGTLNNGNTKTISVIGTSATEPASLNILDNATVNTGSITVGGTVGFFTTGNGQITQGGGTVTTNGSTMILGSSANTSGTYQLNGGTLTAGSIIVGQSGTGSFQQSAGTLNVVSSPLYIGRLTGGTGTFTQTGGLVQTGALALTMASSPNSAGTYQLRGGVLNVGQVNQGTGPNSLGQFVFDGGTLRPAVASATFMSGLTTAAVAAGGAKIDTPLATTIPQDLTHSSALGSTLDGGLTKLGQAILTLSGANTYTGTTTIEAGTLALASNAQSIVLNGPSGVDLHGGTLVFQYSGSSPITKIESLVNAAAQSGFTTGQVRATAKLPQLTIGYRDNGVSAITMQLTLPGDADLSGQVDFNDFLVLQNNFGSSERGFFQGDFNYNGAVDFNDFLVLQNNFGASVTGSVVPVSAAERLAIATFARSIPEPASLLSLAAVGCILSRRRRMA